MCCPTCEKPISAAVYLVMCVKLYVTNCQRRSTRTTILDVEDHLIVTMGYWQGLSIISTEIMLGHTDIPSHKND
jgi:hypothetical protein